MTESKDDDDGGRTHAFIWARNQFPRALIEPRKSIHLLRPTAVSLPADDAPT